RVAVLDVPFAILLRQFWKFRFDEWNELLQRRRHQEQHASREPLRARIPRGLCQSVERVFAIGDPRHNRHRQHSGRNSGVAQTAHCIEPQVRTRRAETVVTEKLTVNAERSEILFSSSMSRTTRFDFVVMESCRPSRLDICSRMARVALNSPSAGW